MVSLTRRSSDLLVTGNVIAVSTSAFALRESFASVAVLKSLAQRFVVNVWVTSNLAAPVTHIWYFKGVPSRLGYLLDLAPKDLEKVIYFAAYMITEVDAEAREEDMPQLEKKLANDRKKIETRRDNDVDVRTKKLEADLAELEAEDAKV
jgi:hypothetical protein